MHCMSNTTAVSGVNCIELVTRDLLGVLVARVAAVGAPRDACRETPSVAQRLAHDVQAHAAQAQRPHVEVLQGLPAAQRLIAGPLPQPLADRV